MKNKYETKKALNRKFMEVLNLMKEPGPQKTVARSFFNNEAIASSEKSLK